MKKLFYLLAVASLGALLPACQKEKAPPYKAPEESTDTTMLVLLNETFGTTAVQTNSQWPAVEAYTGYSKTGKGAANVVYEAASGTVSVRSNFASNYEGASGSSEVMMATSGAAFVVKNIASCGAQNLTLSFGSTHASDTIAVEYSADNGTNWTAISYTKTTNGWGFAKNILFTLPAETTCFALKFTAARTRSGARVDDITVATADPTGEATNCGGSARLYFLETFGTSAPTTGDRPPVTDYTDYDNKSPIVFSGNADVRATNALNPHVWLAAWSNNFPDLKYLTISGINTADATNLKLSFSMANNAAGGVVNERLTITVKDLNAGGTEETPLTLPATTLSGQNVYSVIQNITGIPITSNLEITFKGTQANTNGFRIDNIRIEEE